MIDFSAFSISNLQTIRAVLQLAVDSEVQTISALQALLPAVDLRVDQGQPDHKKSRCPSCGRGRLVMASDGEGRVVDDGGYVVMVCIQCRFSYMQLKSVK